MNFYRPGDLHAGHDLVFLGVYGMVLSKNYMKKLMAMNVMQVAVIFFFLCLGQRKAV